LESEKHESREQLLLLEKSLSEANINLYMWKEKAELLEKKKSINTRERITTI